MVILQKWSLYWRENGHVMDVVSFMEEEWSFYRGAHLMDICIFYCILWSISGVLFLVYSSILPFNLLIFLFLFINVFLHTAYRGAGELYACKN